VFTCPRAWRSSLKTLRRSVTKSSAILREARQFDANNYGLAAQEVIDLLLDEESTALAELESFTVSRSVTGRIPVFAEQSMLCCCDVAAALSRCL